MEITKTLITKHGHRIITGFVNFYQFTSVSIGIIIVISLMVIFLSNPHYIYLNGLNEAKTNMIEAYNKYKFDFLLHKDSNKTIVNVFDSIIDHLILQPTSQYFTILATIGMGGLVIPLLSLVSHSSKSGRDVFASGVFAMVLTVFIFYKSQSFDSDINVLSISILNATKRFQEYGACSICFNSNKTGQNMKTNMLSLAQRAFECCGILSYKDVTYRDLLPFTCCSRQSYANEILENSEDCEQSKIYDPCGDRLFNYLHSHSIFKNLRHILIMCGLLHFVYALESIIYGLIHFEFAELFKCRKMLNKQRYSQIMAANMHRMSNSMTLNQVPSLLSNEIVSQPNTLSTETTLQLNEIKTKPEESVE